ncbi:MAG TPA: sigma-70 family RNA polymerase sigma factor [Ktedonobacterales bacterium]|nr:sigma-70 family RNA polymerase sigma factor [Ktedonobacterales bacterium]
MSLHQRPAGGAAHIHDALPERLDEELVRRVYKYVYRAVGNREDAEDLTERAFTRTLRDTRDVDDGKGFERRLFETARSLLAEHLRAFYRTDAPVALSWDGETDTLLAALPARDRELLMRRFPGGETLGETAERLQISAHDALAAQWSALTRAAQVAASIAAKVTTGAAAHPFTCDCPAP